MCHGRLDGRPYKKRFCEIFFKCVTFDRKQRYATKRVFYINYVSANRHTEIRKFAI